MKTLAETAQALSTASYTIGMLVHAPRDWRCYWCKYAGLILCSGVLVPEFVNDCNGTSILRFNSTAACLRQIGE